MRRTMEQTIGGFGLPFPGTPFPNLEEMGKQNVALFERAMKMFAPFNLAQREQEKPADGNPGTAEDPDTLRQLKRQVDLLQQQLDELTETKNKG
jgi:polyhydroxyalkanoate synthesis regulator protein